MIDLQHDISRIALLSPALGTANVGDHFIELAIRRLLGGGYEYDRYSIRRPLGTDEVEAINAADCAVICGTNLYQHKWESALTPRVLDQIKVPIIPFGVGGSAASLSDTAVGPLTRRMIHALHERCAVSSVRDPHGAEVLERAGVKNYIMTGCPVLFWANRPHLPAMDGRPRRLVITARNWLMHRWPDNVDNPVQVDMLRTVLKEFDGVDVIFALHEDFDRSLIDRLQLAPSQVLDSADPEQYLRLYTDPANVVLAARLHAGMLSLANGVPTLFVGHDTRTYAFCKMVGMEWIDLFSPTCAADCVRQLRQLLDGDVRAFAPTDAAFQTLRIEMDRFLDANKLSRKHPGRDRSKCAAV